jgi:hypothetical protein
LFYYLVYRLKVFVEAEGELVDAGGGSGAGGGGGPASNLAVTIIVPINSNAKNNFVFVMTIRFPI